jgi:hypothetical protein
MMAPESIQIVRSTLDPDLSTVESKVYLYCERAGDYHLMTRESDDITMVVHSIRLVTSFSCPFLLESPLSVPQPKGC